MSSIIGVRREVKNRWERRAPLTPDHVGELVRRHGLSVRVQPSARRVFSDLDYEAAGATVTEDLSGCEVILGVKEISPDDLLPGKTYLYFSHVIKGQSKNMPMLSRLLEIGSTLIDYEPIADRKGRRLIFFGRHAGYAGMIDSLWALGKRLEHEGFATPLQDIRLAHQYTSLDEALAHVGRVGDRIRHGGFPPGLRPLAFGFTGSGNVSQGAQEVFDRLPFHEIDPEDLERLTENRDLQWNAVYKTVFDREKRYERRDGGFDREEFAQHPDRYCSALARYLPRLTVLINGIYWDPATPRLVTRDDLASLWREEPNPKLRVIGDITCDIGGSIEATVRSTDSGAPVYVYEPESGRTRDGVEGDGPVIMAVDNLPCELPSEASHHFGDSLMRFVPPLARCDWSMDFDELALPEEIARAIVTHKGKLTPSFEYLRQFMERRAGSVPNPLPASGQPGEADSVE